MEEFESIVRSVALGIGVVAEGLAALIVAWAVLLACYRLFRSVGADPDRTVGIRVGMGKMLTLSLEFLLAADIVQTAVAPTWDEIGKLAAIAALRTLLNYFLEREIREADSQPPTQT